MSQYHVNPSTQRPNKCSTTPDKCPYTTRDDQGNIIQHAPHYNTKEEARASIEKENKQKYSTPMKPLKKNNEKMVPDKTSQTINSLITYSQRFDSHGYNIIDTQAYALLNNLIYQDRKGFNEEIENTISLLEHGKTTTIFGEKTNLLTSEELNTVQKTANQYKLSHEDFTIHDTETKDKIKAYFKLAQTLDDQGLDMLSYDSSTILMALSSDNKNRLDQTLTKGVERFKKEYAKTKWGNKEKQEEANEKMAHMNKLLTTKYENPLQDKAYGSQPELDKLVDSKDVTHKTQAIKQRYGLDKLVSDKDQTIRAEVAEQGYGLDQLFRDESPWVRATVAEQGYGLGSLAYDKDSIVRASVARNAPFSRLSILVDDPSEHVRAEVAKRGYSLERLQHDRSSMVKSIVEDMLKKQ